ncbi:hypothetical protein BABINDRAFT_161756 [Babjeviella inositovora NRRL Y-12698]|uniref:Pyrroline-5-carboxylate reductase n=1 Tax=Babjeviella inositovora NRRL Y-12698 TaxID=984486 RepID=A0A1E3QNY3_9ASCO|nr:uncharacterized protein BABINDRAFT_161756 [Babjeviella inositovora NRRL Y-12698]ODQ79348.1 hypothetical protein BABINDRAFT_161756 [Babjeviella inositovora NRRL Y-12698]
MKDYTLTVLGCGVMGTAVISALLSSSDETIPMPKRIILCTGSEKSAVALKQRFPSTETTFGVQNNSKAVADADVLILGCKPFLCQSIYDEVKVALTGKQLVISLLAGWTIDQLKIFSPYIARVMTNTPAAYGCGMAVVAFSEEAKDYEPLVMKLVDPVGKALQLPEKNMDAATALVGSGPAFCLLAMEGMIEGAIKMGIPYATARECAAKVMEGTAKMLLATDDHPAALKAKVCTPGGTTIGGLLAMEDRGVKIGIARGIEEAANIATQLGKK